MEKNLLLGIVLKTVTFGVEDNNLVHHWVWYNGIKAIKITLVISYIKEIND